MPWCPQCKTEYREGFNTCANCNVTLIDEMIEPEEGKNEFAPAENWVLVKTLNNEHEATIVESLLMAEEIKVLKKYRDIGDYLKIYMGMSNLGIDIFVPEHYYAQAEEILKTALEVEAIEDNETIEGDEEEKFEEDEEEEYIVEEDKEEMRRKNRTLLIILFTAIPALIYLVFSSYKNN